MLPFIVLLIVCTVVSGLPPKGCNSCLNTPSEPVASHAGKLTIVKELNTYTGCFVQKTTCSPNKEGGFAFLSLNYGQSGFGREGEQTVEFLCNANGEWTYEQAGRKSIVNTISCHST